MKGKIRSKDQIPRSLTQQQLILFRKIRQGEERKGRDLELSRHWHRAYILVSISGALQDRYKVNCMVLVKVSSKARVLVRLVKHSRGHGARGVRR